MSNISTNDVMNLTQIIAQIINGLGTISNMIAVNNEKKSKTLIFFIIGNGCIAIASGLLGATTGMIIQTIFVIETIINYFWEKKHSIYPLWLIIIYILIPNIILSFTFESMWDILPILGGIFFPLGVVSKNFALRLFNLLNIMVWIPYNFHFGQYVGTIGCLIFTIANLIAIIKFDILKRKK